MSVTLAINIKNGKNPDSDVGYFTNLFLSDLYILFIILMNT